MKVIRLNEGRIKEAAAVLAKCYGIKTSALKRDFTDKVRNERWLVAVEKDQVVGVLGYLFDYSHYANYIEDLGVLEDFRRKGVAKALVGKFIEISRKEQPRKQPLCLSSTDVTNKASIAFHKKMGFTRLGRIKALHYGRDEIIFGYRLF